MEEARVKDQDKEHREGDMGRGGVLGACWVELSPWAPGRRGVGGGGYLYTAN